MASTNANPGRCCGRDETGKFLPEIGGNQASRFSTKYQPKNRHKKGGGHYLSLLFAELDKEVLVEVKNGNGKPKYVETTRGQLVLKKLVDMAISGSASARFCPGSEDGLVHRGCDPYPDA